MWNGGLNSANDGDKCITAARVQQVKRDCQGLMKEEWSVDSEQSKRKQEVEYFRGELNGINKQMKLRRYEVGLWDDAHFRGTRVRNLTSPPHICMYTRRQVTGKLYNRHAIVKGL